MSETSANTISPYTHEELKEGSEELEKGISSIAHDVEAGEQLKIEFVLDQLKKTSGNLEGITNIKFVFLGSMGMYARLNELRSDSPLLILEQRIASGKNDYDIGVGHQAYYQAMDDFGWDDATREVSHGFVGDSGQMIDLMQEES